MMLLPPPAGFDGVSRASSTADLPLPPPPAFFDGVADCDGPSSPTSSVDHVESVGRLSAAGGLILRGSPSELAAGGRQEAAEDVVNVCNGVDSVTHLDAERETSEITTNNVCGAKTSCNGVEQNNSDSEVRSEAAAASSGAVQPVSSTRTSSHHQARFARDVMDKLDQLCRAEGVVSPPSSAATVIPVHHETTSDAGRTVQHRRSLGQSWSDGLFIWDKDDPADRRSKRHSAGASLSAMLVSSGSGGVAARPKVLPLLAKSRSALDGGADWRRRPAAGMLRAQSAGVVSPHHQQIATRRLFSRYTPDGREVRVHSETSRVEVKQELRHRSLEPDDSRSAGADSSCDSSSIAAVLSDSNLPSTSTDLSPSDVQTRRFFSQQSLLQSGSSSLRRRSLLEQVGARRNASRLIPKLGLTSLFDAPSTLSANAELSATSLSTDVSAVTDAAGRGRPVRVLAGSSPNNDESPEMSIAGLPVTSAERSMETVTVSRPPSLVVRGCTSDAGSPVRVLLADSSPQSRDQLQTTSDVRHLFRLHYLVYFFQRF